MRGPGVYVPEPVASGIHCPICTATNSMDGHRNIIRCANEEAKRIGRAVYECAQCGSQFDVISTSKHVTSPAVP